MATAVPILFTFAAIAAIMAIGHSVRTALPALRMIRTQFADGEEYDMIVSTLETRDPERSVVSVPVRHRGKLRPKPVTHRLHQFPRATQAA